MGRVVHHDSETAPNERADISTATSMECSTVDSQVGIRASITADISGKRKSPLCLSNKYGTSRQWHELYHSEIPFRFGFEYDSRTVCRGSAGCHRFYYSGSLRER